MSRENWPQSYLRTFSPFVSDDRSARHLVAQLEHHLGQRTFTGQTCSVLDVCSGVGQAGRTIESYLGSKGLLVETTFLDKSEKILDSIALLPTNRVICADVASMGSVASDTYDVAVCRYGFNNLTKDSWLPALGEVLRVLKGGGVFLLQDHFVPGAVFSVMVNEAEQYLARMEGKPTEPFIFSTEDFNVLLDEHPLVATRIKSGYSLVVNIWDRLRAKRELLPNFEAAKGEIMGFYTKVCLERFKVLIVDPEEYIPVYVVTYAIVKRQ